MSPADLMMLREQGDLQPRQIGFAREITWDYARQLYERGGGVVGAVGESIVVIGGAVEKWEGTGFAWLLLTSKAGPHMREIFRETQNYLKCCSFPRIELLVESDFVNGHRFARLLNFDLEAANMRKWSPDGKDMALYSMVR